MKDPAFLFYTGDFQSGTIDMSCEEVGAYLRLLMYQHQNKEIPNDKERLMRITGIFTESKFDLIWLVVGKKFMVTGNHLVNQRMSDVINQRESYKPKKIASATFAGLISSNSLSGKNREEIKKRFNIADFQDYNNDEIKEKVRDWFYEVVNQMVNNIENENENEIIDIDKEGAGEKEKEKTESERSFERFNKWVDDTIPYLRKIRDQMTYEEYSRITEKYNGEQIRKILTDLSNYKDAPKKYVSVNLTFKNWAKKEYG